jgi:hypothetical protein
VATDPSPDLTLTPLKGPSRTVSQWLTTFHLVFVALDPFTHESAWILSTAGRILLNFQDADCRIAWLVAGDPEECELFLGPWAREILTFSDQDRSTIKGFGIERLPAIVHVANDGTVVGSAEGWEPLAWRQVTKQLAKDMGWLAPVVPLPGDPGPYEGTPASG